MCRRSGGSSGCRTPTARVRMRFRRLAAALCVVMVTAIAARKAFATPPDADAAAITAADAQIVGEVGEHSEAMQKLEYLSDSIGGMGARHERSGTRAGGLFRCEDQSGLREV